MSEVNPDPVAKLAKFTPAAPDAAELLFAAGRASARTHWGWKAAVAGLLASNLALGVLLVFSRRDVPSVPEPVPAPVVQPQPEPPSTTPPSPVTPADEPWSYRTLRATDLEHAPKPETLTNLTPPREALTVLSGRSGDLD